MDFNLIIVAVATLLGSLGSSFLIGHYNTKSQKEAIKTEFRKRDEERRYKERQELIRSYNYVFRKDGEISIVRQRDNGLLEMDMALYSKEIRSALYEQYSKLDIEVAEILIKLDKKMEEERFLFSHDYRNFEVLSDECCGIYFDLIKTINSVIDAQRGRTQLRID